MTQAIPSSNSGSRKKWAYGLAALLVLGMIGAGGYAWRRFINPPWNEEYAYTKGLQAVVYAFPYVLNSSVRWAWSQPAKDGEHITAPKDAINQFFHASRLTDAKYRDGGTPNNDTAYSTTWAYIDQEPLIIEVPDIGLIPGTDKPRYYSFEFAGFDSDNFAYIGTRTTGNGAGNYAIVPKGWTGKLPPKVTFLAEAPTPWFLILGRTLVTGEADFPVVSRLIQGYRLKTLSDWENNLSRRPPSPPLEPVPHYKSEQRELLQQFWSIANRAMTENPPRAADDRLVRFFADIEVGPGRDLARLDAGMQRGLERAAWRGLMLLPEVNRSNFGTKLVNGWKYPPMDYGRAGVGGSFLVRAAMQSLGGILANDPDEAVYLVASRDAAGELFDGKRDYRITFGKNNLPPVGAFWSMTIYDSTNNLVDNRLDRYSLGDRTPGMHYDQNGDVTLYIGQTAPAGELSNNWLPAPAGEFYLVLRTYLPGPEIVKQTWVPPAIELAAPGAAR